MKLSWKQFCQICKENKPSQFKPPDWAKVETAVAEKLKIDREDKKFHEQLVDLKSRYKKYQTSQKGSYSKDRSKEPSEYVLDSSDFTAAVLPENQSPPPLKKPRKSLDELGKKQLKSRTEEIWTQVELYAEENNETPLRILGLLLKKCNDKNAREYGDHIWSQSSDTATPRQSKTITNDSAIAIMVDCQLGRETYSKLRKILKQQEYDILPPWIHLRETQREISPKPKPLPEPHKGVQLSYSESMMITARRIMEDLPVSLLPSYAVLNIKFGFDGSGSHAIYKQAGNEKTNNIIMSMFCPLSIICSDTGGTKWTQHSPNSALTQRPLALQLGKESVDTLQSLQTFDQDINDMKENGFAAIIGEKEVNVKVNVASHMMDLKAANLYMGTGGAFCDLCSYSREDCHDPEIVKQGFEITRSVSDLHNLFDTLSDEDGNILKRRNDYETRQGLTTKPIPDHEVVSVQVLHALLRTFDHYMKIAVHLKAEVFEWTESETSRYHVFLKHAKKEIQKKLEDSIGERWDFPDATGKGGTSTTGNTARNILHHHGGRKIVIDMLPERFQGVMTQIGQYLSVVLRLFSSSKDVNVAEFKKICTSLYLLYLESFPPQKKSKSTQPTHLTWVSISPSLHKLLGHSWELIEMNGNCGLKAWDESGLEANNKILRSIRLKLARKTSQSDNLEDCINRLWLGSDPKVNNVRIKAQPYCKHCKEYGHSSRYCRKNRPIFGPLTDDDALFDALCM